MTDPIDRSSQEAAFLATSPSEAAPTEEEQAKRPLDAMLSLVEGQLEAVFLKMAKTTMQPVEAQKPFKAILNGLAGMKDFSPWFGTEQVDVETIQSVVLNGYPFQAETTRVASLLTSQLVAGLAHSPVQTYVESVELRFYPQHDIEQRDGSVEPGPYFELEITLATIVNVPLPSLLDEVHEADSSEEPASTGEQP